MRSPIAVSLVVGVVLATGTVAHAQPLLPPPPPPSEPASPAPAPTVQAVPPSARPQLSDPALWGGPVRPLGMADAPPPVAAPDPADFYRLYGGAEYLLWWIRADRLPPLVSTSPPASNGIIGFPGTTVLFGGDSVSKAPFSGIRYTLGYWFGDEPNTAFEVTGFVLAQNSDTFSTTSNSFPVIARPFFNVNTLSEFSEIVASPGISTGSIAVDNFSRVWGIEANGRRRCPPLGPVRFDLLGGFRFLDIEEGVTILENVNALPGQLRPLAAQGVAVDNFHTRNQFYGAQIGGRMEVRYAGWFLDLQSKVALGSMNQAVTILGAQQITSGGVTTPFLGGLLALPSNVGTQTRNEFAVVPEANMNVGYQVASCCRLYVGYSFICASSVVRPANQINRALNVSQIPNFFFPNPPAAPVQPIAPFSTTAFWAQGINFSCEFRY